jgi:hypothetical protein
MNAGCRRTRAGMRPAFMRHLEISPFAIEKPLFGLMPRQGKRREDAVPEV